MTDPKYPTTPATRLDDVEIFVAVPNDDRILGHAPVVMRFGDYEVSISPHIARRLSAGLIYAAAAAEKAQAEHSRRGPSV